MRLRFSPLRGRVSGLLRRRLRSPGPDIPRYSWGGPARLFVVLFVAVDLLGAGLLTLPVAHAEGARLTFVEALFTATTALGVCGLSVIDLGAELSTFGQVVVVVLMQVGGIGIMTLASVLGAVVIRGFGLRMQLGAETEMRTPIIGSLRGVVRRIVLVSLLCEAMVALILVPRLWLGGDLPIVRALYHGTFHAVAAFNNAGLSLYGDSLTRFSGDPLVLVPVAAATILGGLGFPVLLELRRSLGTPHRWSLHVKLTVVTTALLFAGGVVIVTGLEWTNPATLGTMPWPQRILSGAFHGIMPRSGGFNVVDVGEMHDATLLVTIMLMFVGGGSAGTAGGIKVASLAVIFLVVWAEIRGHWHVHVFGRRVSSGAIRQALSLMFLSMTVVVVCTAWFLVTTRFDMVPVLFEVVSAFGVTGLSTGITPDLPPTAQLVLVVLMIAGRIGPITFASALALRERTRRFDLAESRPIIG